MKILRMKQFLQVPAGTIYIRNPDIAGFENCVPEVFVERWGDNDWTYYPLYDVASESSEDYHDLRDRAVDRALRGDPSSLPLDFECVRRNAMYETETLFAVFTPDECRRMAETLLKAAKGATE